MKPIHWLITAVLASGVAASIWLRTEAPKVAYVRSNDLIYGYFGTKEAMENYRLTQEKYTHEIDTMTAVLRSVIQHAGSLDQVSQGNELRDLERTIAVQQRALAELRDRSAKELSQEESELLKGVLAQINAFVERYAEEHDLDVVLGTTNEGSLMYGKSQLDITDELLAELNQEHGSSTE